VRSYKNIFVSVSIKESKVKKDCGLSSQNRNVPYKEEERERLEDVDAFDAFRS
jgi:hypothetical protein